MQFGMLLIVISAQVDVCQGAEVGTMGDKSELGKADIEVNSRQISRH